MKEYRGCDGKPKQPFVFEGKDLERCPLKLITPATFYYIRLHNYYEKGYLPFSGGIQNQPAKIMEAFEVIEREKERVKNARKS